MNCVAVTLQSHCQVSRQGTSLPLKRTFHAGGKMTVKIAVRWILQA